jgi:hypothetical protein
MVTLMTEMALADAEIDPDFMGIFDKVKLVNAVSNINIESAKALEIIRFGHPF